MECASCHALVEWHLRPEPVGSLPEDSSPEVPFLDENGEEAQRTFKGEFRQEALTAVLSEKSQRISSPPSPPEPMRPISPVHPVEENMILPSTIDREEEARIGAGATTSPRGKISMSLALGMTLAGMALGWWAGQNYSFEVRPSQPMPIADHPFPSPQASPKEGVKSPSLKREEPLRAELAPRRDQEPEARENAIPEFVEPKDGETPTHESFAPDPALSNRVGIDPGEDVEPQLGDSLRGEGKKGDTSSENRPETEDKDLSRGKEGTSPESRPEIEDKDLSQGKADSLPEENKAESLPEENKAESTNELAPKVPISPPTASQKPRKESLAKAGSKNFDALMRDGNTHLKSGRSGDLQHAIKAFKRASTLSSSVEPLSKLAESYSRSGAHAKAYETYKEGIRKNPNYRAAQIGLARAYRRGGSHSKAKTAYEAYLSNFPDGNHRNEALKAIQSF